MNFILISLLISQRICNSTAQPAVKKMGKEIEKFLEQDIGLSENDAMMINKHRQKLYTQTQKIKADLRKLDWRLVQDAVSLKENAEYCKIQLDLIAENSRKLSSLLHEHMKKIKNLCNKDQAVKLKKMLTKIFRQSKIQDPPPPRQFKETSKQNIE